MSFLQKSGISFGDGGYHSYTKYLNARSLCFYLSAEGLLFLNHTKSFCKLTNLSAFEEHFL